VKFLVVHFSRETTDRTYQKQTKAEGTFRLLRTPQGDLFASFEQWQLDAQEGKPGRFHGLLNHGKVYVLSPDTKYAIRFEPSDGDVYGFLKRHFIPFILLFDQKRARKHFQLEVVKQDEWYTYLTARPREDGPWAYPLEGRLVLMNKSSPEVPKDMLRQLSYLEPNGKEHRFEITAWRMNTGESPTREEFTRPEDRPGWEVRDWALRGKK
jgi:hypothetical protein